MTIHNSGSPPNGPTPFNRSPLDGVPAAPPPLPPQHQAHAGAAVRVGGSSVLPLSVGGRAYIARVHSGVSLLLWSFALIVLTMAVTVIGLGVFASMAPPVPAASPGDPFFGSRQSTPPPPAWFTVPIMISAFALSVVSLVGYWRFTTQFPPLEPFGKLPGPARTVRIGVQLLLGTLVTVAVSGLFVGLAFAVNSGSGLTAMALFFVIVFLAYVVTFAASVCLMIGMPLHVRWLAERIPDAGTASFAKTCAWLIPVMATVGVLLIGLGPLVAVILYVVLLTRIRTSLDALRKQMVESLIGPTQRSALPA